MQIAAQTFATVASKETAAPHRGPSDTVVPSREVLPTHGRVNFSSITPRQLVEYLDEMIFSGQIDPADVTALSTSLPSGILDRAPDAPIDLTREIEGMVEFDRTHGFDVLASFYAGLLERMKLMEARSVHLSVEA